MALPINITDLIHGKTIEWERLEFKQGWNPEDVLHSMCAFANDLHNWGGGYIIVGVAENDGQPILPPTGLQQSQLDAIQKKVIELGNHLSPTYFPIVQPYVLQGQHILVLWCPAGDNRPYIAPSTLGSGAQRHSYVRVGTSSIAAKGETLRILQELTARIPFDDRVNNQATLQDLDLGLIQAYLQEIKSDLLAESTKMSFPDLCRSMLIAKGTTEDLRSANVGLLFFSKAPERFFPRCWIELVVFQEETGKAFKEHYFKGPLHHQLRDALQFIQSQIIQEQVVKSADKAEADRYFNFPFVAIEESLSNAVYHKSYELGSPIEVQVWPDKIQILSHPEPMPPVNATILKGQKRIVAREYRNRRIGDFLKELHLTEGRGTGFPSIYRAMAGNGSPEPVFETDDKSYFLVTIPAHSALGNQASNQVGNQATNGANSLFFKDLEEIVAFSNGASNGAGNGAGNQARDIISNAIHDRVREMLIWLLNPMKRSDLFEQLKLTNQNKNRAKYLDPLIELRWVAMEFPEERTHPAQTYRTTSAGKRILNLIGE
jgi:ATP-dependent DNA helicase RecG